MNPDSSRPRIGVGVIVWRGDNILLGERLSSRDAACWQFPGGHLEAGESVCGCALREVQEETGLIVSDARDVGYTDRQFTMGSSSYITLFVSAQWQGGEAEALEPDKCARWAWCHYQDLPQPLFEPISLFLSQHTDLKSACSCRDTPAGGRI